jgi:hypothetical protein
MAGVTWTQAQATGRFARVKGEVVDQMERGYAIEELRDATSSKSTMESRHSLMGRSESADRWQDSPIPGDVLAAAA